MARKASQPPEPPLMLTLDRSDAEARITSRIQKGIELRERPIHNEDAYEAKQKEYWTWSEYNTEMLRQMFTSPKPAEEYSSSPSIWFTRERTFQEKVQELIDD